MGRRDRSLRFASTQAAFQSAMNVVTSGFSSKNVKVLRDDILIMTGSFQEHLVLVKDILRKLEEVCVKMKVRKCK